MIRAAPEGTGFWNVGVLGEVVFREEAVEGAEFEPPMRTAKSEA